MEVKYCSYRSCKSDNRSYADKPWMEGVWFIPFPKPDTQLEKCIIWVSACGRENFTVEDVNKHTYICSLHFVGGNGPSNEHPHPIAFSQAATASDGIGISKHFASVPSTASSRTRLPFFRYFQVTQRDKNVISDKMEEYINTNSIIAPVKSEILEQSESEVLPACSNPIQTFICSRPSTIESSGSNVNNTCIENQNLGSVAHENNSGLIYNIKQEPVDEYSLTNVYNESQDSTQNSVVNNDSQTSSFSPIIYGNVDSNNHNRTNMEKVTSSSILNKTHVNKEKQSIRCTPTIVLRRAKRTHKIPSSDCMGYNASHNLGGNSSHNMEDNSSHNTRGNSTIYLFSDQAKIPQLPPKDTGTGRLSENQSLEPQIDNTDWRNNCLKFLKDTLQNTINRLEDLGVEVAAWVLIPNNDKSSLIHHMGSKKGTEFVKSKPDINTELHLFLQNYKKKDNDKKDNRKEISKKKLEDESCSVRVENMETSSCDGEPSESISENKAVPCSSLNDCKPINVLFSVKGSDNKSSCIVVRQAEESSKEELQVNTASTSSSNEKEKIQVNTASRSSSNEKEKIQVNTASTSSSNEKEKIQLKRKIDSVDTDPLSDDEKLSESSKEEKVSLVNTCKEIFADKYAIATSKEKAEFPYKLLNMRGTPWITATGFPEDLLPLRHPSQFDIDSLKRIIENKDKMGFNIHRNRFKSTPSETELEAIAEDRTGQTTKKQTAWGVRLFRGWLGEQGFSVEFEELDAAMLNERLRAFYGSLQTKQGSDYSKSALIGIRAAISRHISSAPYNRQIHLMNDRQFMTSNHVIVGLVKRLRREGKDITKQKKAVTKGDIKKLYESGVFNTDKPETLQNKVFWDIMLNFCCRGIGRLQDLKKDSFVKVKKEDGMSYYKMSQNESRLPPGTESSEMKQEVLMYEKPGDVNCPIYSLDLYLSKLSPHHNAFFQQPRPFPTLTCWYADQPMGKNKIACMMGRISAQAGLSHRYTNRCIRATVVAGLRRAGIDVMSIMSITGHKSVSSVDRSIALPSDEDEMSTASETEM